MTLLSAPRSSGAPLHLLVDSTGLKLCGPGEWLIEKHGTKQRRSWHALHIGMDAGSGRIVAATLTDRGVDEVPLQSWSAGEDRVKPGPFRRLGWQGDAVQEETIQGSAVHG
ncbi:transposase [Azospirillum sp. CT11-132]|uniref:transposase n=1 Tax=Azospirillum sp. CT11-132 TaxID=3396317 RepID=UPI0039A54680